MRPFKHILLFTAFTLPLYGAGPGTTDVVGITITQNEPQKMTLQVDVDNREEGPVTVQCVDAYKGQPTPHWQSSNTPIEKGRRVYTATIEINPTAPDRHESDAVLCRIISTSFWHPVAERSLPFPKTWIKPPSVTRPHQTAPVPNAITDIRVISEMGDTMLLEVDYSYSGDHGDEAIALDCRPSTEKGTSTFGLVPRWIGVGRQTVYASIRAIEGTLDNTVSTSVRCQMMYSPDNASLADKTIAYRRLWKPTLMPSAEAAEAMPNKIFTIRVLKELPAAVHVEVDYLYSGDHGEQGIYLDCSMMAKTGIAPFSFRPIPVQVGRHRAQTELEAVGGLPPKITSTAILCSLNARRSAATLIQNAVPYERVWKK